MTTSGSRRPPRLRALPAELVENLAPPPGTEGAIPDAELLDRLEAALAQLPAPERAAVMSRYGYGEAHSAVGEALQLSDSDADALSRNALQLLRGALSDTTPADQQRFPTARSARRRRKQPAD